jgi:ArsR family transcriptional regulator
LTSRKANENNGTSCLSCGDNRGLGDSLPAQRSNGETVRMTDKSTAVSQVDLMFRAFCDRTRLRILSLLQDGELCVGDIVESLQVPQPKVSRHLANLRKAGLVTVRKEGLWCHYSLAVPKTSFHRKLLECAVTCFKDVPEIKSDDTRAKKLRKDSGCCPDSARRNDHGTRPRSC